MNKHDVIYRDLRKKVLNGTYAPRSSLESEEVLCKRYEVSRPTLRKALDRLKQDGLVHSRQGAGIFVNPPEFYGDNNLTTLSERYRGRGVEVTSRVLLVETVEAADKAGLFQVAPEDPLIHYERLRLVAGEPHAFECTWMPEYLFRNFTEDALMGSMISFIEDESGYAINHVNKEILPVVARGRLAGLLDVEDGTPLLQVNHSVYMIRSVLMEYTEEVTRDKSIRITSTR